MSTLTGLLAFGIVISLPSARRSQTGFNESVVRAHKIAAEAVEASRKNPDRSE